MHLDPLLPIFTALILIIVVIGLLLRLINQPHVIGYIIGALLSQIGEFSFLLAAIGFNEQIITEYGYQLTIILISLSLLLSPIWIMINKKLYKNI